VVWKIVGALVIDHAWFQNARTPIIYDKWPGDPPFQTEEEGISDGDGKMVDVLAFIGDGKMVDVLAFWRHQSQESWFSPGPPGILNETVAGIAFQEKEWLC